MTVSTINTSVPAYHAPLLSATVRNNFVAAANDINALWTAVSSIIGGGSVTSITAGTGLSGGTITSTGTIAIANASPNTLAGYDVSGIFANVTIGSGLSLSSGVLSATGAGTITSVSVASSNGFTGSSSGGSTPILTLTTSVSGVIKGNGTALLTATAGADYSAGTAALTTGILKSTTSTGALTIAVAADFPTLNQDTAGTAANATNTAITNDTATNSTMFLTWVTANTGNLPQKVTSTKLTFNPSTGVLSSTSFTGAGTGLTGTAASLTAGTVTTNANLTGDVTSVGNATTLTNAPVIAKVLTGYTSGAGTVSATDSILQAIQKLNGNDATNANLTGPITSVGNATSVAAQTGTGTTFVMQASPTLTTPNIGVATGTSLAASGVLSSGANLGTGGQLTLSGSTSGSAVIKVAAAAGAVNFQLPITNGTNTFVLSTDGSGNTSWIANGTGGSPLTTKGDLYTYTTNIARLAVGTDGQVLVADSAQAAGIKWATVAGSGTVITSGSPASGNLAKFSAATTITNGDLSGDITTSGTLATTVAKIAGTTVSGTSGSGNVLFSTSPTMVTPTLGAASATSINKVAITAPATSSTLTIADGKTFAASNTLTLTGTDGSSVALGTGGTVAYTNVATLSSLTSIGTITTGVWNGTAVDVAHGGTGVATLTPYGVICGGTTSTAAMQNVSGLGTSGQVLTSNGAGALPTWQTISGSGTVTSVSVVSINGFAGSVATPTTTPAITISTSITGLIKGNGTAISAATSGTDYSAGTSGLATGILKSTTATGVLTIAIAADFPTLNQNTTGSAATLTTARTINGVLFDGSAAITVTAAAGTLTGATLNSSVTASSLTSFGSSPTLITPILGTPTSGTLTNCTGLPISGVSGLGTNVSTFLSTPSSANLLAALTDKTGTGVNVFATSPTLVTPVLGVAAATTINKVAITAPATGSTLTIADGKTATISNTLTLTGTDGSSVALGTGGTVAYTNVATLSSLTSIGTITTGVWNGTAVDVAHGGTGVATLTPYGVICGGTTSTAAMQNVSGLGTSGQVLTSNGAGALPTWQTISGSGTVTSVSVVSINGFAGSVATPTTTPAITISTSITGLIKGNGTAISAATSGTDYSAGTSGLATGILKSTTATGVLTIAIAADFPTLNQNTTGSAATLTTARTINGVLFDGSAAITVTAAAGTLTGATLNSSVTASSLTSFGSSPTLITPILGTPTSGTLTNCTGLPISGVSGLGTNVSTFLSTPSSANLLAALTDKTGTGVNVFATSPTLVTPVLGVAAATTINKVAITAPATGSTLTIADGKTATISNTLTFTGTDSSSVAFGAGGTVAYTNVATLSSLTSVGTLVNLSTNNAAPTSDGTAIGPTTNAFNAGYTTVLGDLVYLDSSATWQKTDANTLLLYNGMLGIILQGSITSGNPVLVALPGSFVYMSVAFPTLTIGGVVYMSETAGAITQTAPTTTDAATRVIGWAVHPDKILFYPSPDYITHT